MGIFKKIGKGIKTAFNSIGKKVKKAFKSFGKFMGEIGILGQIAMMFILPGIGNALMGALGGMFTNVVGQTAAQGAAAAASTGATATAAATAKGASLAAAKAAGATAAKGIATKASGLLGSKVALLRGAGTVLKAAGNFVKVGSSAFSTVTEGISTFVSEFGKTALNKVPGITIDGAASTFGGAWGTVQESVMANADKTLKAWNAAITSPTAVPAPASTVPAVDTSAISPPNAVDTTARPVPNDVDWVNLEAIGDKTNLNVVESPAVTSEGTLATADSSQALAQQAKSFTPKAPPKFSVGDLDIQHKVWGEPRQSLLGSAKEISKDVFAGVQKIPSAAIEKAREFADNPLGKVWEGMEDKLHSAVQTKALTALQLLEKQETPVYNQYVSNVPSFQDDKLWFPALTPEQVALSPHPFGNTAYQHENYMSRMATG